MQALLIISSRAREILAELSVVCLFNKKKTIQNYTSLALEVLLEETATGYEIKLDCFTTASVESQFL